MANYKVSLSSGENGRIEVGLSSVCRANIYLVDVDTDFVEASGELEDGLPGRLVLSPVLFFGE